MEITCISHQQLPPLLMAMNMKLALSNMVVVALSITLIFTLNLEPIVAQIGVCYGMLGNNLPSKGDVIALYKQHGITRMRIYDPNPEALQALQGSNIEVSVGVLNQDLERLASSPAQASAWVQTNIRNYAHVRFRYIVVGNEIQSPFVLPAMENIHNAITAAGLRNQIRVTTAVQLGLLGESYPPSNGVFREDTSGFITPIARFLAANRSPLLVNVYPYFAYTGSGGNVALSYALFQSPGVVVRDGPHGYQNIFDAMLDSFYWALEKVGAGSVDIVVSETGWPTSGGSGTSLDNQRNYITNLINHVKGNRGTPKRPGRPIETYIFGMFDENEKTPDYEKFWGLFTPNKQIKYPIRFT